ncbi:bifunctional DNA primase/polymerase [Bradyrhizobium sp. WU425]|uniref:bifunctional DNA primase/polymerase n=1 Tax=Bradyrhizobium sp. WU425 TaxID=187029 RepID=UPI001E2F3364|nr:bifunctional DNA primase/polymerase [Bradyrhizobium canariense]UFW75488.1 bifunctional DNA primase/polymerase [Bradyrhizobium canariense]
MNAPVAANAGLMLRHALDYAERGYPVFPCSNRTKAPLPPKDTDPETGEEIPNSGGLRKATTDRLQITEWWTIWPNAMIGVATGERAGFWAIDPDAPKGPGDPDGRQELARLQLQNGNLPPTHTHLTPNGGKHMLFRWRNDKPITNREGGLKRKGINVRGEGGYLIFPPSQFFTGKSYEIEEPLDCFSFADAPEWLYDLILARPEPKISDMALSTVRRPDRVGDSSRRSAYADAALDQEIGKLASETPRNRNNQLNASAFSLAQLVASGDLDERTVTEQLMQACAQNGLLQEDGTRGCMETIKSGFRAGLQHPREIKDRPGYGEHTPFSNSQNGRLRSDQPEPAKLPEIIATPYRRVDPKTIPLRDWLYGHLLIRKFVTATVSPGGVGKSSLVTVEALAMASGRDLLGVTPKRRLKVWLWNLEDPQEETQRKVEAAALHYGLKPEDTDGFLFMNSGRDTPLVTARMDRNGAVIVEPVVNALVEQCIKNEIDVLVIDPFVSSHEVPENDNTFQDKIIKEWGRVADRANIATHLVDHTRKMGSLESEVTVESARGAKAKTDGCRVVRVVNRMSEDEAGRAGVENRRLYFRTFLDKESMAPPAEKSDWFKLESVDLGNAPSNLQFGDSVGVVAAWTWPDLMDGVTASLVDQVFERIKSGRWRDNHQAKDWVGVAVAQVMNLDLDNRGHKAKIGALLKTWKASGSIVIVEGKDEKGNLRPFVEVSEAQQ